VTRYSKPWLKDYLLPFPLAEVNGTVSQKAGIFKSNIHNTALAVIFGRDKKKCGTKDFSATTIHQAWQERIYNSRRNPKHSKDVVYRSFFKNI
jgi:hypothetical protein